MTGLATGRGRHLPHDVGLIDAREEDVHFVRAMRDFSQEEVNYYAKMKDLEEPILSVKTFSSGPMSSIEQLTESFVLGLQVKRNTHLDL